MSVCDMAAVAAQAAQAGAEEELGAGHRRKLSTSPNDHKSICDKHDPFCRCDDGAF